MRSGRFTIARWYYCIVCPKSSRLNIVDFEPLISSRSIIFNRTLHVALEPSRMDGRTPGRSDSHSDSDSFSPRCGSESMKGSRTSLSRFVQMMSRRGYSRTSDTKPMLLSLRNQYQYSYCHPASILKIKSSSVKIKRSQQV